MATFAIVAALAILVAVPVGFVLAQTVTETMGEAPTGLTAERSSTTPHTAIDLSWTAPPAIPEDDDEAGTQARVVPTSFRVDMSRDGNVWELLADDASDSGPNASEDGIQYTHGSLMAGDMLYYRVFAQWQTATELSPPAVTTAAASTKAATQADPPTGLTVARSLDSDTDTAESPMNTITLFWTEPTTLPAGTSISGYQIEYSMDEGANWAILESKADPAPRLADAYKDDDLAPGTTRHYRVSAVVQGAVGTMPVVGYSSGVRSASTTGTAPAETPEAPTGLVAVGGNGQITLYWKATDSESPPVMIKADGYKIAFSSDEAPVDNNNMIDPEKWSTLVFDTGSPDTTYLDSVPNGTVRHYQVFAIANGKTSTIGSNFAQGVATGPSAAKRAPDAPTNLKQITAAEAGVNADEVTPEKRRTDIVLKWDLAVVDGGRSDVTRYDIQYYDNPSNLWKDLGTATDGDADEIIDAGEAVFTDDELVGGTRKFYRVRGVNAEGNGGWSREAYGETTPQIVPATAPIGLKATGMSTSAIKVEWTAPNAPSGSPITGYSIEYSANGTTGSWTVLVADTGNVIEYTDTMSLEAEETRHYRIFALNNNVPGPFKRGPASDSFMGTTDATGVSRAAPGSVTGEVTGNNVTVEWTDGAGATSHLVALVNIADFSIPHLEPVANGVETYTFNGVQSGSYATVVVASPGLGHMTIGTIVTVP
jgi:hypothetical protein